MSEQRRYLDVPFPDGHFDIEVADPDELTGFRLMFGHVREAFLERLPDGSYRLKSPVTGNEIVIRAVELGAGGVVASASESGEDLIIRIKPLR